jgi:TPR repeat protein
VKLKISALCLISALAVNAFAPVSAQRFYSPTAKSVKELVTPAPRLAPSLKPTLVSDQAAAPVATSFDALRAGEYKSALAKALVGAAKGDAGDMHLLGFLYEKGLGVSANIGIALKYYGDAAAAGSLDAYVSLGDLAFEGRAVMQDYRRAAKWYELAAIEGDARAEARLAALYTDGLGVAQDLTKASALYESAAAKNDVDALFTLGLAYLNGDGRAQDFRAAANFFARAMAQGHAGAAFNLALLYDAPVLGAPDRDRATALMRAAAEAGHPQAMTAMGLYAHRADENVGAAIDWFERAARAGDLQGRFLYAVALANGDGRPADKARAKTLAESVLAEPTADDGLKANARHLLTSLGGAGTIALRD